MFQILRRWFKKVSNQAPTRNRRRTASLFLDGLEGRVVPTVDLFPKPAMPAASASVPVVASPAPQLGVVVSHAIAGIALPAGPFVRELRGTPTIEASALKPVAQPRVLEVFGSTPAYATPAPEKQPYVFQQPGIKITNLTGPHPDTRYNMPSGEKPPGTPAASASPGSGTPVYQASKPKENQAKESPSASSSSKPTANEEKKTEEKPIKEKSDGGSKDKSNPGVEGGNGTKNAAPTLPNATNAPGTDGSKGSPVKPRTNPTVSQPASGSSTNAPGALGAHPPQSLTLGLADVDTIWAAPATTSAMKGCPTDPESPSANGTGGSTWTITSVLGRVVNPGQSS